MRTIFIRSGTEVKNLENRLNEELVKLAKEGIKDEAIYIAYSLYKSEIPTFQCALITIGSE